MADWKDHLTEGERRQLDASVLLKSMHSKAIRRLYHRAYKRMKREEGK